MTQFDDRIEGEVKSHEKEMLRNAIIKKYGDKALVDRIRYVTSTYEREHWTEEELFAKLTELGLNGNDTPANVADAFKSLG